MAPSIWNACGSLPPAQGVVTPPKRVSVQPHKHDYDEVLCFFGTDPEDFYNLNGEVELSISRTSPISSPKALSSTFPPGSGIAP